MKTHDKQKEIKDAIKKQTESLEEKAEDESLHEKIELQKAKTTEKSPEEQKQQKIDELTDMLKRTQAEFINYKSRIEKDHKQMSEYHSMDIIRKLLPIVDSFEQALKNEKDENAKKGMELIFLQLKDVLKNEGVKEIECTGKKFDPYKHEVLMKEKSDKEEGTILEEFQKGYELKDRIIRHSKVKISG